MTPKKKTASTPDAALVPEPNAGGADLPKSSPPLDIRSTVLNPQDTDPTTIIALTSPIPDATNTSFDHTEAFKTSLNNIIEYSPFLITPIYYEPKTLLLQLEDIKQ